VSYSPFDYWKERGKIYKKNFHYDKYKILQEEFLLDHLDSLNNFHSVLELGCGFGRITKLSLTRYSEIQEYLALDLSPQQRENAKTYLDSISFLHKGLEFQVSNIQSFKSEKKYDLVILSEVLMHILPSEIDSVIGKLVSLSNKHIINIDWFEEAPPQKIAPHNLFILMNYCIRNILMCHRFNGFLLDEKKYSDPSIPDNQFSMLD